MLEVEVQMQERNISNFSDNNATSEISYIFRFSAGTDAPIRTRKPAAQASILKKRVCSNEKYDRDMNNRRVRWDSSTRDKPKHFNLRSVISWIEPIITPIATFICMKYLLYG